MMLRFLRQPALGVAMALVVAAAAASGTAPDPIVCPPLTQPKRIVLSEYGVVAESCRDDLGRRQGPYRFSRLSDGSVEIEGTYLDNRPTGVERSYNVGGELLYSSAFADGKAGATQFTAAGLRALSNEANSQLKQDGKQVLVYPSNEGGLIVEHGLAIPHPGRRLSSQETTRLRDKFFPLMCGLLIRNPGLNSVSVRLFWTGGEIASVEKFRNRNAVRLPEPPTALPASPDRTRETCKAAKTVAGIPSIEV